MAQPDSTGLWFEDGTIIIQAGDTLFRVYSGLLSRQSPMLVTQGEPLGTMKGCPLVLHQESAERMRKFLHCLINSSQYVLPLRVHESLLTLSVDSISSPTTPQTIFDLRETSDRYGACRLLQMTVACLSAMYPSEYRDFVAIAQQVDHVRAHPFDYTSLGCNIAVANLARKTPDLHVLLPVALYRLCKFDPKSVHDGGLAPENLRALMIGRPKISSAGRGITIRLGGNREYVRRDFDCQAARTQLIIKLGGEDGWVDPFDMQLVTVASGLCRLCIPPSPQGYGIIPAWDNLPLFFELLS